MLRRPFLIALALLTLAALVPAGTATASEPADLVLLNATVHTVDPKRARAEAVAVRGNRIVAVGTSAEIQAYVGPRSRVMDLRGRTVVPGFDDAHAHFLGIGFARLDVDLVGTGTFDDVVARVEKAVKARTPGEWIRGRGWDQNDWADTRFPSHEALSLAVPNNPVYLTRVDGHAALVNAKALEAAGVTASTQDPDGGRFIRDDRGSPTGVLIDRAQGVVSRVIPPESRDEIKAATLAAIAEANRWGLTGIHDAGVSPAVIAVYEELARAGQYNLRNYVMVRADEPTLDSVMRVGRRLAVNDRLWIRSIKITADGALGSRGAALLEDYSDEPGNRGLITADSGYTRRVAAKALRNGFQLNIHAIGDRANRSVLDIYQDALREVPTADHRFRIEHAQILRYQDLPRFAELGVIPSMQGSHQTSDMYWVPNRIGWSRSQGAYAWRSLLNTGVVIPNGSDFPVEAVNPLISFRAFFTRTDADGFPAGGWFPGERTTRDEALLSISMWPAYAAFMEDVSGSLTPGKYADLVVLDQDIMTVEERRLLDTQVLMTVLGGKIVYRRN